MNTHRFVKRTRIEVSARELFDWHARPGALERLTPPWSQVEVVERSGGIADGRVVLRMPVGPVKVRWVAQHYDCIDGLQFRDRQEEGPFGLWEHTHRFEPDGPRASCLVDDITYAAPLGAMGNAAIGPFVPGMLEQMFTYRHAITSGDLETHGRYPGKPLRILVSGSSGMVGSALIPFLTTGGHEVVRLVRGERTAGTVRWDPAAGILDAADLEGFDAVVHLAGESIASGRWTDAAKQRILSSRVAGTKLLSKRLAELKRPPAVLISASAIGFYGNRGDEGLDETSPSGLGFLADVCRAWEKATAAAEVAGIRVVHQRLGVVLSASGGALQKMLPPFQLGLGGRIGDGTQYMSWISLDDLLGSILHAVRSPTLRGPVNAVAPNAVTNAELTQTLGRVLHRPTLIPVPAAALRLALGEMADEMLLGGARVLPAGLMQSGFVFRHPTLESALRHTLGRGETAK